jgi:hypothetical protein
MRLISLAGLLAAIAIGVAGCGSSSSATSGTGSAQGSQPPVFNQQARAQFRACMQSQGVTTPNGRPQSGQRPDAKTQKAMQACRQYLPQRGGFGGQGA